MGCAPKEVSHWQLQSISAEQPEVCSRYLLSKEESLRSLEIEWHNTAVGAPLYLNVYGPPLTTADQTIDIKVTLDEKMAHYQGRVLEGNQRILVPIDLKEKLLDALQNKHPIVIRVGRYSLKR